MILTFGDQLKAEVQDPRTRLTKGNLVALFGLLYNQQKYSYPDKVSQLQNMRKLNDQAWAVLPVMQSYQEKVLAMQKLSAQTPLPAIPTLNPEPAEPAEQGLKRLWSDGHTLRDMFNTQLTSVKSYQQQVDSFYPQLTTLLKNAPQAQDKDQILQAMIHHKTSANPPFGGLSFTEGPKEYYNVNLDEGAAKWVISLFLVLPIVVWFAAYFKLKEKQV